MRGLMKHVIPLDKTIYNILAFLRDKRATGILVRDAC